MITRTSSQIRLVLDSKLDFSSGRRDFIECADDLRVSNTGRFLTTSIRHPALDDNEHVSPNREVVSDNVRGSGQTVSACPTTRGLDVLGKGDGEFRKANGKGTTDGRSGRDNGVGDSSNDCCQWGDVLKSSSK